MIDIDGYRPNVGIILLDDDGKVFFAKRNNDKGWQFPQGGINSDETNDEAMYRELYEEIGLLPKHVQLLGSTAGWLKYRLPKKFQRKNSKPLCIGQKQVWYLLKFKGNDSDLSLDHTESPEFDDWKWVHFWYPVKKVIKFKKGVYIKALRLLEPIAKNQA
jgi:putative (di)nucleoside polyphosphate hydrolase